MSNQHTHERQDIDWLYSREEQRYIQEMNNKVTESVGAQAMHLEIFMDVFREYLLADEKIRILKRHFNLSEKQFADIIQLYRSPAKTEAEIIEFLNQ